MPDIIELINYTKKFTLLYVEDNKDARDATLLVLEEFFGNIIVAIDGKDGLEKFHTNQIDIIITDINMPHLNGIDMIAKIRESDKNVPILVLSAYNESGYFMDSIKLGVDGYLLKPISMEQYISLLDKIIQKFKYKMEIDKGIKLLHQYQEATDSSNIVSKTDIYGVITYVNDAFCEISEYSKDELIGKDHSIIRHPDNPPSVYEKMWNTIKVNKQIYKGVMRNRSKNNRVFYLNTTIKPILDENNEIQEYIALRDNVTDMMSPLKRLYDYVETKENVLLVLVKIESYDELIKLYGHAIADDIEKNIVELLEKEIPKIFQFDKIYILGDGEYAFAKAYTECSQTMQEIEKELKEYQQTIYNSAIEFQNIIYDVSILISVAYGKDVIENTKFGMKHILSTKQQFIMANDFMLQEHEEAKKNVEIMKKVKYALENDKIVSYFQPIVNNETQIIEKYESLVRLIEDNGKVLSPFFFLDLSKKGRYYSQITSRVLEKSFKALESTQKDISINLSALDIEKKFTREKIFELLHKHIDDASRVVFELLEDENVKDFDVISSFIQEVKKLGVKIAIDDFGAGYSNFERLLDYQPDILKIDACLIKDIVTDSYALSVVKTIIRFTKEQNIKTVAEYVENEDIYNILKEIGIDYSQGYYFGKPESLT